ncbi:TonB-dependent receptor [Algoriphagus sp. CAU 1675]|uniref:TonB-dependent receptor plug domain-containing protein n=1 Tax=Algoriphagus sp. CAU 1675 TaxID=3032597 RepID=UPI0023DB0E6B|nr:TonB-dependent receptor [Algoriphagus sp. CAU 1675]MDF2159225.1 TonB-dependent receptor [Algoriphagus sp. CAU 1675]
MILFIWVISLFSQASEKLDTLALQEVQVSAPAFERFGQGQKVLSWNTTQLARLQNQTLSDLLSEQSPVFVRSYGPGMLASPSFRGTSAGHTAIYWNGLPLNSPSLGQSDLSLFPLIAVDHASLQFGSAGALVGNEAIGGSVHLNSKIPFNLSSKLLFSQEIGSFGQSNTHLKWSRSWKKTALQSKYYRHFAENDYPFKDLSLPGTPEKTQEHARVLQEGFVQDFSWRIKPDKLFKSSFWYNRADREIQAPMGSSTQDLQKDESFRWVADYEIIKSQSQWILKSGLVSEKQFFNQSLNQTRQFLLSGEWDYASKGNWSFHMGSRISLIKGELSTYSATDQRIEFFQFSKYQASEKLILSLNLRQQVFGDTFQPFIPGAGLDWKIWKKEEQELTFKFSGGKGFKVPTLNDRFWSPGGNPDLLPEKSWSAESGFEWKKNKLGQTLTFYTLNVDNWIIWLPQGSIWTPQNIKQVISKGIEYSGNTGFTLGQSIWESNWSFSFNKAVPIRGTSKNDASIGKQLPYTPIHQAAIGLKGTWKHWLLSLQGNYTGQRNITADSPKTMAAYKLFHLAASFKGLKMGRLQIPMQFRVQNIFNTDYQAIYLRAMPGRSYHFNLSIQL